MSKVDFENGFFQFPSLLLQHFVLVFGLLCYILKQGRGRKNNTVEIPIGKCSRTYSFHGDYAVRQKSLIDTYHDYLYEVNITMHQLEYIYGRKLLTFTTRSDNYYGTVNNV